MSVGMWFLYTRNVALCSLLKGGGASSLDLESLRGETVRIFGQDCAILYSHLIPSHRILLFVTFLSVLPLCTASPRSIFQAIHWLARAASMTQKEMYPTILLAW